MLNIGMNSYIRVKMLETVVFIEEIQTKNGVKEKKLDEII